MPIYARKKEGEYSIAPEGLFPAVCVDVFDLGLQESPWGPQEKIEITWQLEERDPKTNKRYLVFQRYTPSLHEKSRLRPMLEAWRGRRFSKDEEREFDVEKLVGVNCQVQVVHNVKDEGRVYSNIQAVVPPAKQSIKLQPEDYIRRIDREKNYEAHPNGKPNGRINEDSVPF